MIPFEQLLDGAAALAMIGILAANFVAPTRFRYADNLAGAERFFAQVFYVHCAYLIFTLGGMALFLTARAFGAIPEGGVASGVSAFGALFWGSRVFVQLFYYDPELRRNNRGWDSLFLGAFLLMAIAFVLGI